MTYQQQIDFIAAEIAPVLKAGLDPQAYAAGLLDEAEDDAEHFEVRGLHTRSGAPHTFWLPA
jgi:hypothetical protein